MATQNVVENNSNPLIENSGNPIISEVIYVIEAMGDTARKIVDIKARVDEWLAEDELAPADEERFNQAMEWLAAKRIIDIDEHEMATVTEEGSDILSHVAWV